jgi:hypothetical protein
MSPIRARKKRGRGRSASIALIATGGLFAHGVHAQREEPKDVPPQGEEQAQSEAPKKAPSPWLLLPTFSNNPKLRLPPRARGSDERLQW